MNTPQTQYTDNMMSAEEYFKTDRNKMDNIYSLSTNNNNNIIQSDQNTPLLHHHDMSELKAMNGQHGGSLDEQRALQLALELSMLGLTNEDDNLSYNELRMKKSMNMTECVPVPSSEHVAEIVGRQGKYIIVYFFPMCKYLFKVSKIMLQQRSFERCSNVILLTLNRYFPARFMHKSCSKSVK